MSGDERALPWLVRVIESRFDQHQSTPCRTRRPTPISPLPRPGRRQASCSLRGRATISGLLHGTLTLISEDKNLNRALRDGR